MGNKRKGYYKYIQWLAVLTFVIGLITGCDAQPTFKYVEDAFEEEKGTEKDTEEKQEDVLEEKEINIEKQEEKEEEKKEKKEEKKEETEQPAEEPKKTQEDKKQESEGEELVVDNPDDILVWVNKERNLPKDYIPEDLVVPNVKFSFEGENEKKYLRKEAAEALENLFAKAVEDKIDMVAVSGYRSYARQESIFNWNVKQKGYEEANKVSARPGQSEHQTGLAMDVSCKEVGYDLVEAFEDTKEGVWLKENAHQYGFIIRYPKDKVEITKYSYEPWHIRYVGVEVAQYIYEEQITLEEYFELP